LECVKLLVKAGAEINPSVGWTPLSYAAFNGQLDIGAFLIEQGAQVDARVPNGMTSLMLASRNGHIEIVKLLLASHADIGLKTAEGKTAMDIALEGHQTDIVELFKQAKTAASGN
jgi:ankyrin repeat protein